MSVKKLLNAVLTIAGITLMGGAIEKKPGLINLGLNLAATSTIGHLVVRQNQQALEKQQLATATQSIQPDLTAIEETLKKQQKLLKEQRTRQNFTLSKVSKLDRKQKVTAIAISQQVDKLIDIAQDSVRKDIPSVEKRKAKKPTTVESLRLPVTRIYIDGNNFGFAAKEIDIDVDFRALRLFLMPEGKVEFNFYTGVSHCPTFGHQRFISILKKYGYRVSQLPVAQFEDGNTKTVGDDMTIGLDMVEEAQKGDRVILISGDGDFIPAVKRVQNKGAKVTVIGLKDNTSFRLRQIANDFIDLNSIKYKIAKHTKLTIA